MPQQSLKLNKIVSKSISLDYLLYLPSGYDVTADKKWPLILFLHGAGERGNDINKVKKHGIPKIVEEGRELPFVVISPQCPELSYWPLEQDALISLLDEIIEKYNVDINRIYMTGLSMGGYGTWSLSVFNPHRFAAIAPICGGGDPRLVHKIKHIPVWTFHGAKDETVPIRETEGLVNALKAANGNVKFTIYPDAKHDSWTETYNNPELYDWFLEHQLNK